MLIGHYFGCGLEEAEAAVRQAGSLAGAIDLMDGAPRRLHPRDPVQLSPLARFVSGWEPG